MNDTIRPRRSVLYMPGSNQRALEKAKELAADALILDLEDAVAPEAKAEARDQVCAAVTAGGYGKREIVIRINSLDTPWGDDDLAAAAKAGPDAILVPKISSAAAVKDVETKLDAANAPKDLKIWSMMETPLGILHAEEIAAATPRQTCWVMGTNDIAKDMHAAHTPMRLPMITSLGLCMLAASAYGLTILDGVYNDIKNEEGFAATCQQGLELGFDGKTLIHPSQLGPCNEIFAPKADEVTFAKAIIAAFEAPENQGKGVIKVEGKMVELLHRDQALRTVAIANAIADMETA
ncbi:MAG: HpcH/HpaI aldolase/citrate lyase family protein [Alphaproteobacteria bacterium]